MATSFVRAKDSQYLSTWQYLANWVLAVILGLAFVFYFARLAGYIFSRILGIVLWKRNHVCITIGAFRVSPLGGRIMARNVVISTADCTVSILRFNLTWRYWLLRMMRYPLYFFNRESTESLENVSGLTPELNLKLPTSLLLHVDGLEVFVYNRTAAFDNIEETLKNCLSSPASSLRHRFSTKTSRGFASETSASNSSSEIVPQKSPALLFLLQILPIQITIKRGAFVLGNHTTPSILVASFRMAKALLDIYGASSVLDEYRTNLDLSMDRFQVLMKPNITYDPGKYTGKVPVWLKLKATKALNKTFRKHDFQNILPHLGFKKRQKNSKLNEELCEWYGLRRYVGNFEKEHVVELTDIEEYAKYSLILDSVSTQVVYYYDTPGVQPMKISSLEAENKSPQMGVDIFLSMATVHYGSWSDRQRGPLQSLLFPGLARDSEPTLSHNAPGSLRKYAGFNLQVFAKNELIVRVPTREFSKDKEDLVTRGEDPKQKNTRPFGWVELKLAKGTEIKYNNSYVASAQGWANALTGVMVDVEVRSSVTHGIMFTADKHVISAVIGFPLAWNGECTWTFDMKSSNGKFFFLREHITLFLDMVADFGSGPPAKFENYRPFTYYLNWSVLDFKLYFNVNDHNIINDPLDFDSNKYICFSGAQMDVRLKIPLRGMFDACSTVEYAISTPLLDLYLEMPLWHTVSAFTKGGKKMGCTDSVEVSGFYTYYSRVEVDHNNFAAINITGDSIMLLFHGYLIRYLFAFRENYFGDFVNFRTFEEYMLNEGVESNDPESSSLGSAYKKPKSEYWKLVKAENDLNIQFTFKARKGRIIFPCQIYDYTHHIGLCFDFLDVDIHLCKFYMDLQADFSTGKGYHFAADALTSRDIVFDTPKYTEMLSLRRPEIIIDTLSVHTHRMLGIDDLTYHCKWDFACDLISICGKPDVVSSLDTSLSNFALGYKDLENSLTYHVPVVHDAANFSFRCPAVRIRLEMHLPSTFLEVLVDDLLVTFNDIANYRYSSRVSLLVPNLVVQIVDESEDVKYDGYLQTSLHLTNFCEKLKMKEHRDLQQEHIKRNDATTHRTSFLLFPEEKDGLYDEAKDFVFFTVSLPMASFPLTEEYMFYCGENESHSSLESSPSKYLEESSFANGEMNPTTKYFDEDFKPLSKPDERFKHDSFVLKFEPVKACFNPKGLFALSELALGAEDSNIDLLLDKLQCDIMKDLKKLILPVPMINNIRLVCPLVDLRIVEQGMATPTSAFLPSQLVPVLTLAISEPSLVLQKQHSRTRMGSCLEEQVAVALAAHVSEFYVFVSLPNYFASSFSCQVSEVEAWCAKTEGAALVVSLLLNTLKTSLKMHTLVDVVYFVKALLAAMEPSVRNFKKAKGRAKRWKGELIYSLCKFAVSNKIVSDPEVITKPARVLRSKRDHVRFYEAWKIMTKLRSIAKEVPAGNAHRYTTFDESYKAPHDAIVFVTESFKAWRTWEGNMKQRENFFRTIFLDPEDFSEGLKVYFAITTLELDITGKGDVTDAITLLKLTAQALKLPSHQYRDSGKSTGPRNTNMDIAVNINALDIAFTRTIVSLLESVKSMNFPKTTAEDVHAEPVSSDAWSFSFVFNLNTFSCQLSLIKTQFTLTCEKFTSSSVGMVSSQNALYFSWALNMENLGLSFGKSHRKYFSFDTRQTTVIGSGTLDEYQSNIVLELSTAELDVKLLDEKDTLVVVISEFLEDDMSLVRKGLSSGEKARKKAKTHAEKKGPSRMPSAALKVIVEKLLYSVEALYPLKIHGTISGGAFKLLSSKLETLGEYAHGASTLELDILETSIIRINIADFHVSSLLADTKDCWLINTEVRLDYIKVTTPLMLNALGAILKQNLSIVSKFDTLKKVVLDRRMSKAGNSPKEALEKPTPSETNAKNVLFKVKVRQKYCSWFTYKDNSRFMVEFEDTKITLGNAAGLHMLPGQVSGELHMPATRFSIYDPLFSVGLSNIMEYHLCVKILNDTITKETAKGGQSLQIESEYFRVCLSPVTLFKVYELTDILRHKLEQYNGFTTSDKTQPETQLAIATRKPRHPVFTSMNVLGYNFCICWLFGASHEDYPGLILGAERIFAVTKADMGKLTVMDGYLSVANGSTSSSFNSSSSEFDNLNRAFMPKVQLNYFVDSHKKLWLTLKGDELDVRCMSSSTVLIERAMHSGTQVRKFFEGKAKMAESRRQSSRQLRLVTKPKSDAPPKKALDPHFSAVQCIVGFAGARIFLYKLQEDNLHGEHNSLTLQSPAILIVVDYSHVKNAPRKHMLKAEVLLSQSDNTVYASCVPVVEDFVRTFKDMFAAPSQEKSVVVTRKPEKEKAASNLGAEFGSVLENADIHVGMRIEKQRVSLSCEPTAKVAAVVEYGGASILACSGNEALDSIYVLGHMNSISASLRHIYSDERSGSLLIKSMVLSSMIAFKTDLEVVCSCSISDLNGNVKMKQYQDVDLFTDIWFPKSYDRKPSDAEKKHTATEQLPGSPTEHRSAVSRLSVALDFILSHIALEVDFGPALGTMILEVDKAWAISRKISSWSYEFKVGLQTLLVAFEGRLGGYLKLGGLFLNSSIEWKLEGMPLLEVPLVHMAGGFGEFQLKSIFDEHCFAFANFKGWRLDVYNRKYGDHLFAAIRYDTAEAFMTSLAASDFYDIYETVSRMIEEKRTSYKEILKDSNKEYFMHRTCSSDFLEVVKKLDTQIDVFSGITTIQVYPHSFHDSKVFVMQLDRSTANFAQNEYEYGMSNQIELQLNNVRASFSSTAGTTKEDTQGFDVDELSAYAFKAKGGLIIGLPRFMISMRTYQKFHTNLVEYLFQSSFGGTVDIRWNLGSVNIVREMYAAHKRALLSRTEMSKNDVPPSKDDFDIGKFTEITKEAERLKTESEQDTAKMLTSETPHNDFDRDMRQTTKNVTSKPKYTYVALAPAIIEAPKLKELGNATPPLEWFGLHRNKFPDATHQLAIVALQKLIHGIELEYSKKLGKP